MANIDIWEYVTHLADGQAIKARHCRGCKYLGEVAGCVCCNYILVTDKRRPGKFGQRDCPVKKYIPGYAPTEEYLQWIRQMDELVADQERKQEECVSDIPTNSRTRRRGRPLTWDVEYAHMLYCKGYFIREISEIMGVSIERISSASYDRAWKQDREPGARRIKHGDLDEEKRAFRKHMDTEGNAKLEEYNKSRCVWKK